MAKSSESNSGFGGVRAANVTFAMLPKMVEKALMNGTIEVHYALGIIALRDSQRKHSGEYQRAFQIFDDAVEAGSIEIY